MSADLKRQMHNLNGGHGLIIKNGEPQPYDNHAIFGLSASERHELELGLANVVDELPRALLVNYYFNYANNLSAEQTQTYFRLVTQSSQAYSTARSRRSDFAFPPSQIFDIYGPRKKLSPTFLREALPAFHSQSSP